MICMILGGIAEAIALGTFLRDAMPMWYVLSVGLLAVVSFGLALVFLARHGPRRFLAMLSRFKREVWQPISLR